MEKARIWLVLGLVLVVLCACEGRRQISRPVRPLPSSPPSPTQPLEPPEEQAQGAYHIVQRGETLWRICKAYGVDLQQVAEINNIRDVSQIRVGQKIFIPGVSNNSRVSVPRQRSGEGPDASPPVKTFPGLFIWPTHGALNSSFGVRNGIKHPGCGSRCRRGHLSGAASGLWEHLDLETFR
jgi:LysM repeat protein